MTDEKIFTLLLADLVDSTALNSRVGDDVMAELWDQHDAVSRELALLHGGHEIDRTDGFLLLFESPVNAVQFACDYHRRLGTLTIPLRARVGLHVGPLRLRPNAPELVARGAKAVDVYGIAKAKTARLMALAQGGQTLISAELAQQLADSHWPCISHGHWRLKGVDEPVEIFETGDDHAPRLPPPDGEKSHRVVLRDGQWVAMTQVPRWLPGEPDRFVGREADLRALAQRFDDPDQRLVVLHGPGGIGKTRLSIRFAWSWLGSFPGGAYFCDLSSAHGFNGILHAVAHALQVPLGAEPVQQLADAIAALGRCLVVLDNFEQVASWAAQTLGLWLGAAPQARFLVTSRVSLGLQGEQRLALEPMKAEEAVALFSTRAQAVARSFDPATTNAEVMLRLMERLDGLPLAIELAAARATLMTPHQMLARMDSRFKLLASAGGRISRQATMRAAIDASWDGLKPAEQAALAQLSVFEGGFDLDAAEAVLSVGDASDGWGADLLQSLIDKSLLRRAGEGRFAMLTTIQEYAAERLQAEPPAAEATRRRHWRHFATFDDAAAVAHRCVEIDNLVVACRRARQAGAGPDVAASLVAAWAALRLTGPFGVASDLAREARALKHVEPRDVALIAWVLASAAYASGQIAEARQAIEPGLQAALDGDLPPAVVARLYCCLGEIECAAGDQASARTHLERARDAAGRAGNATLECQVLNALGTLQSGSANFEEAKAHFRLALAIAERLDNLHLQGGLLGNIAVVEHATGHLDRASEALETALKLAETSGDRRWAGNAQCNLGLVRLEQGRPQEARRQLQNACRTAAELGHRRLELMARCNLGLVHESLDELPSACREHEIAVAGAQAVGDKRSECQFRVYHASALTRAGQLGSARTSLDRGLELLPELGDPILRAQMEMSVAEWAVACGDLAQARQSLDFAERTNIKLQLGPNSELGRQIARIQPLIRC